MKKRCCARMPGRYGRTTRPSQSPGQHASNPADRKRRLGKRCQLYNQEPKAFSATCPAGCRSVPSGRVGNAKDAIFRSNEHFREAVGERENLDVQARSLSLHALLGAVHACMLLRRTCWHTILCKAHALRAVHAVGYTALHCCRLPYICSLSSFLSRNASYQRDPERLQAEAAEPTAVPNSMHSTSCDTAAELDIACTTRQGAADQLRLCFEFEFNFCAQELEHRLDRRLEGAERARIGVTQLRRFLEQLLQRR